MSTVRGTYSTATGCVAARRRAHPTQTAFGDVRYHPFVGRRHHNDEIEQLFARVEAAPSWDDDRRLAERLGAAIDAELGDGWVAERMTALWRVVVMFRRTLQRNASQARGARAAAMELERLDARIATCTRRGAVPWDVLNDYGVPWVCVFTADGATLYRVAAQIVASRRPRLLRLRDGNGEAQGRRHAPLVRAAACLAADSAADVLRLHQVLARALDRFSQRGNDAATPPRDQRTFAQAIAKGIAVRNLQRPEEEPQLETGLDLVIAGVRALIDWNAQLMLIAARQADHFFEEARPAPDRLSAFRVAARGGPGSAEWRDVIAQLLLDDPDVAEVLAGERVLDDGEAGAVTEREPHAGPVAAAALAVEKLTGVGASTIERDRRKARGSGEPIGAQFL